MVALAAAAVLLTGVVAAWTLVQSPDAGRSRAMVMASTTRPVAGLLMGVIKLANESGMAKGQLPPAAPVLDRTLFDKVQMSTQSFDKHMKKEEGKYDEEIPMRGTFDD